MRSPPNPAAVALANRRWHKDRKRLTKEEISDRARKAGKKGGRPKKRKQPNPNVEKPIQDAR